MITVDSIKKLIEKFKAALKKIEDFNENNEYDSSLLVISEALLDMFRLNLKSFNSLSDETLLEMMKVNGRVDADRCIIISVLLEKEAEIIKLQGNLNESHYIYTKSLNMLLEAYLTNSSPELIEYYTEISVLIDITGEYEYSDRTTLKLIKYYEEASNFAKSEDLLFELLDSTNSSIEIVKKGIAFYERLLKLDDKLIEEGGLTREEVNEAISSLQLRVER